MATKDCNKFAALKKMPLFTKPGNALKTVAASLLMLAVLTPVTQAQSNNIVDSVTENKAQGRVSLGEGSNCDRIENVTSPVRAGQQAFKHWVDRCGKRAELEMKPTKIGETYWLGWSMYVPTDWVNSSEWYDIVAQWATYPTKRSFTNKCGAVGSYMVVSGDTLRFHFQHKGDSSDIQCDKYVLSNINDIKGKWVDFVMHSKWTGNSDGFLKLWMKVGNGEYVQTVNYTGSTFWNDEDRGPYFKMGVYKGNTNWKGPGAPRYLYTDEYRLGDANSSFAEVTPDNSNTPTGSIRVEAEQMSLSNYSVAANSNASAGKLITLLNAPSLTGSASYAFSGVSGVYNLVLGYFDENDGVANIQIKRQGTVIASLNFDQNLGSGAADAKTLVRRQLVNGVSLNYGDKIEIQGTSNSQEWARVDYVEFVPVP